MLTIKRLAFCTHAEVLGQFCTLLVIRTTASGSQEGPFNAVHAMVSLFPASEAPAARAASKLTLGHRCG
jgi:hypothetical protein